MTPRYGFELAIARIVTAMRRETAARMMAKPEEVLGPELPREIAEARARLDREEWLWRQRNLPQSEGERSREEVELMRRGGA